MAKPPAAPPEAWGLLARALAATDPAQPVDLGALEGPGLLPFAVAHGVAPLLDDRLATGRITGIGEENAQALREEAHREAAMDLAMGHALAGIACVLADNGFETLLLKGGALARTVYPEGRLRPRCDTDLWIRPEEAHAVAESLRTFGYTIVNARLDTRSRKQFQVAKERFQGDPLWFDIHHRLSNRVHFMDALDFEECLDGAQAVPGLDAPRAGQDEGAVAGAEVRPRRDQGLTLRIPGSHHLLLHLCVHRVGHGRGSDRERLIWLWDIHLLYGAMDTASRLRFTDLALDRRLGCLCADALQTCQKAFGTQVSDKRLAALTQRRSSEPTAGLMQAGKWRWAWSDFLGQESLNDKTRFLVELVRNRFD